MHEELDWCMGIQTKFRRELRFFPLDSESTFIF